MIDIWSLGTCAVAIITLYVTSRIYRWIYPKCTGILPPGSSGLPLTGETLSLMMPPNSLGLSPFIKTRLEKYGPLFRTNIAFRNLVVSADAQVNHFLFLQEGKLVEQWYLDSFAKLFNQEESNPDGRNIHKYIREVTLRHFGADCIKVKLLTELQEAVCRTLESWSSQDSIEVKSAAAAMFLHIGAKLAFSCDPEVSLQLLDKFANINKGFMSLPLNIPGTLYHKVKKEKEQLLEILSGIIRARLASPGNYQGDFLDRILEDMEKEKFMTLDFIVEHEEILKKKDNSSSSITWQEFKSMMFTLQVINETLRMGSLIPGFLRRAKKDIEINGYTIPAGWGIMIASTLCTLIPIHLKILSNSILGDGRNDLRPEVTNKNFTPFGGGAKQCAGADYTRAFLCIFLHALVTKYRWKKLGGGEIVQNPMLRFKNGLHITVTKKQN